MDGQDWWESHDEKADDWLDVAVCDVCGRVSPEPEVCAACGDEEERAAAGMTGKGSR